MKKILFIILGLILLNVAGCSNVSTGKVGTILIIKSNLDAADIEVGMIYDKDFSIDKDYWSAFIQTVECSRLSVIGGKIDYESLNSAEYTPYFMLICYPQISKISQTTIIAIHDVDGTAQKSGTWIVMGVIRQDTPDCLIRYGGTYGTKQNGW